MADYKILTIPFGRDAVPDMVNDIPSDPIVAEPQRASFKQGFPSITTIPLVAGGIPPEGQDFNGILRDITEHVVHQNKGGMYKFEPEVVAAGGYPKGAVLESNDGSGLFVSLVDSNTEDFNSGSAQWQRLASEGPVVSISVDSSISSGQLGLVLLDASGGNRTFTLPSAGAALGVREVVLRRIDVSANSLVIAAAGTNKLMLDTTAGTAGQTSTELLFAGDYMRLRSDGAGNWWCVGQAQLPGSIASGLVAFTEPGVTTYSVPAVLRSGRTRPRVTVTGGGGGGGGGVNSPSSARGAGGGAGGTSIGTINLAGTSSVSVTVGAGGSGGGSGANGLAGGSSSFGVYLSALGGSYAAGGTASNSPAGGLGGSASGGSLNLIGGSGSDGPLSSGSGTAGSGDGGASVWGGGSRSATGAPLVPTAPGSGGGGSDTVGGAGAHGLVVIEW